MNRLFPLRKVCPGHFYLLLLMKSQLQVLFHALSISEEAFSANTAASRVSIAPVPKLDHRMS